MKKINILSNADDNTPCRIEAYSEHFQTSKMGYFSKIVNGFYLLTLSI